MDNKTLKLFLSILAVIMFIILTEDTRHRTVEGNYLENYFDYYVKYKSINSDSIDGNIYEYAILWGDIIVTEESNLYYKPRIDHLGSGLIRIDIVRETNDRELLYYNFFKKTFSRRFPVPSVYADFISDYASFLATFDFNQNKNTVLIIYDIFKDKVITTIQRDFIAPTSGVNRMVFLNEDMIFIDYDTIDSNENRMNKKEIILFGMNSNTITITEQQ